ncbi:Plasminogen-binding protein PgbA [Arcobacter porcinus]|uniref:Plasminogen-binding protein PgbA n=1 Tax=Arcobacter porcinus TaxID=1935204 RepID=A0A1C0AVQ7_9BACT|nr:Plasminogen-binding protein PgbA [Arcobacter porcinus]OCL90649.1 Plasminogen-binding protein PgbA [Aliarcobacter thereius]OCL82292.1 Plasminogen-binding protein PgbA [Arcobacter porcinus]OCL85414.1 Plasminogen-binding protein PgbA [Arcobacter porcinus]OCL90793.1 Plasminogen-binding protein PgbA [Arcobacter porcinus]
MFINRFKFLAIFCLFVPFFVFANSSFETISVDITNIEKNRSKIEIPNLKIGQSGIVIHTYDEKFNTIVSNAKVISSDEFGSVVEFFAFDDLKQDAIATTKRKVEINDKLILNYLYQNSLLIAPNFEGFDDISKKFPNFSFIHPDILGAKLKFTNSLYPTKKEIQDFTIEQNLGTIFIVVLDNLYILDSKTFLILDKFDYIQKDGLEKRLPFFTRVEDVKDSFFNISSWFKKKDDYDSHYKKILGIKK